MAAGIVSKGRIVTGETVGVKIEINDDSMVLAVSMLEARLDDHGILGRCHENGILEGSLRRLDLRDTGSISRYCCDGRGEFSIDGKPEYVGLTISDVNTLRENVISLVIDIQGELPSPSLSLIRSLDQQGPQVCVVLWHARRCNAVQLGVAEQLTLLKTDVTNASDVLMQSGVCRVLERSI